jgi:hypothetical protein
VLQLDEMGVNGSSFTLKLANSGRTSVGCTRFKSRDAYARCDGTAPLPAKVLIDRRKNAGNSGREAIRILKRRLSDAVFQALLHDQTDALTPAA